MPFWEWGGVIATRPHNDATSEHSLQSSLVVGGGGTLQSEMLPPSEISEQIADYQADIWSNIRFQISDARCRCHNLSVDPDFRFQISDFRSDTRPGDRFLREISDFRFEIPAGHKGRNIEGKQNSKRAEHISRLCPRFLRDPDFRFQIPKLAQISDFRFQASYFRSQKAGHA